MNILLFGSTGQVGAHLKAVLPESQVASRAEADFTNPNGVFRFARDRAPNIIINAAAYTAVDKAEDQPELALTINSHSPAALARAANETGALLIHFSTDYVFDGLKTSPYRAQDTPNPQNVYGQTKLGGEQAIREICSNYWIIRISWVFSEFGTNFVRTMLRLASERDNLSVVSDQHGSPTYAGDVAAVVRQLVCADASQLPSGIYHLGGGRPTTWSGFANSIFDKAKMVTNRESWPKITEVTSAEYPTAASRPINSVLEPSSLLTHRLSNQPDWERGLERVLPKLLLEHPSER